jgi:hypothetical protein
MMIEVSAPGRNARGAVRRLHCCLGLLLILGTGASAAKERISILDFVVSPAARADVSSDASQDLTQQVRDAATSLIDPKRFEVMTRENILVMLPPGVKSLAECEGQCEVETARNLGSRWHVVGDVKKVGTKLVLSVRLYDVAGGTQLAGFRLSGATVDALDDSVGIKARELVLRIPGAGSSMSGAAKTIGRLPREAETDSIGSPSGNGSISAIDSSAERSGKTAPVLHRADTDTAETGIPLLKDIPLLGGFFRHRVENAGGSR